MKKTILVLIGILASLIADAKTLIVYYSYTNNVKSIVNELSSLIDADIVEIQPAEKGLDYAANNYAIGSAQIAAIRNNSNDESSYPAIDPVDVNLEEYDTIIIGTPLWWSQMAAPLQSYLFKYGKAMAGKNIGLIVSSHSSGISGVVSDAKRLIPEGSFLSQSLWVKSAQTSSAKSLLENWLKEIGYNNLVTGINDIAYDKQELYTVYSISGVRILNYSASLAGLKNGIYIINGKKKAICK